MKKITIIVGFISVALIAGCQNSEDEVLNDESLEENPADESVQEENEKLETEDNVVENDSKRRQEKNLYMTLTIMILIPMLELKRLLLT
ncbi:hypothetical protein CR203_22100 [Salipaludibacillus neizhouensis]|uniref:Lipoprotein n=1 Tax=Salipaludibacillus neizhouensis TaxID=885475 RepID=A0A3A9K1M7_9BACI|nr:hypothetical protein [Salipaludibacillus neizhouensis]RKL65158.1 hypothetical protein CR203_22100 [Salipaludibacillus neizhouensis]